MAKRLPVPEVMSKWSISICIGTYFFPSGCPVELLFTKNTDESGLATHVVELSVSTALTPAYQVWTWAAKTRDGNS